MMLDQIRAMAVFAKVVEAGSFRAAARDLNLSPSVVSHHVSRLEAQLGTALMYRTTRKLSVTGAGERLAQLSLQMLRLAEEGAVDAGAQGDRLVGRIKLTAPPLVAWGPMLGRFASFSDLHPDIRLIMNFSDVYEDLIDGGYDLAIRMGDPQYASWRSQRLTRYDRCLVASPTYLARHAPPLTPDDLRTWRWIHFVCLPRSVEMSNDQGETVQVWGLDSISVNLGRPMLELALLGAGVAPLPRFMVQEALNRGELVELLEGWRLKPFEVFAMSPPNAPRGGLVNRLIEHLKN